MSDKRDIRKYSNYNNEPYTGALVYSCSKCKKYYITGGVCPCCEDENKKPIPLRIEPVTQQVYNGMLHQGELFTK